MSGNTFRIEKLGTSKYETWRVQMRCFLSHRGLWHTVRIDPDALPPAADSERACALILLHVEELHFATIQHLEDADACWEALERTPRGGRYARKLRLRRDLHQVVESGSEDIQTYVARLGRDTYVARLRRICVSYARESYV
jgi:hypothetical protein